MKYGQFNRCSGGSSFESLTEEFRPKFLTPEITIAIISNFSDDDLDVREGAVNLIGKIMEYGRFSRRVVEMTNRLNLHQRLSRPNS
jgi:hypothetical protein